MRSRFFSMPNRLPPPHTIANLFYQRIHRHHFGRLQIHRPGQHLRPIRHHPQFAHHPAHSVYHPRDRLRVGLAHGIKVAHAISESWLPRLAPRAGDLAALVLGFAVPVMAVWLLRSAGYGTRPTVLVVAGSAALGAATIRRPISAPALTVVAGLVTLIWRWSAP